MPLRFIQVFVSEDGGPDLETLLEGHEVLGTWHDTRGAGRLVSSLLVAAEAAEEIMDRLEQAYSGHEGFRVILFPVEAVLPRPKEVEDPEANGEEQSESSNDGGGRISREELYHDITETLGVTRVYIPMVVLSSIVAAVGLARDDVAVVIGAMVIAPLLGPNVAMSLAVTLGDLKLLRRALLTNIIGVSVALVIALLMGVVFSIDPTVPAIESRTHLRIGDLVLALAAGSAGTFAFTRGMSGTVIGVMVAVALMPPLVTLGMLVGGGEFRLALGAFSLLAANVVCVNLAGVGTFLAQGVRPRTWWEEKRAKTATRIAIVAWCVLLFALSAIVYFTQVSETDRGTAPGSSSTDP